MSLDPIGTPSGLYTADMLFLDDIPLYDGFEPIEEPALLRTDVAWNRPTASQTAAQAKLGGVLAHTRLGGKITICVLCYGDNHTLHRRCLSSIARTVPSDKRDLRIALNCVGDDTRAYADSLRPTKIYSYTRNRFKYPAMRDMLWDTAAPITTPYVVWFDDDTYASHSNWLNQLAQTIIKQPDSVGMFGNPRAYRLMADNCDPRKWFSAASWFKGRHFRTARGTAAPNGDTVHYCDGWFWAMKTAAIRQCDIPCSRLRQLGGDVVIGEQLHQNGFVVKRFNVGKSVVYTEPSGVKPNRLPLNHNLPWLSGGDR